MTKFRIPGRSTGCNTSSSTSSELEVQDEGSSLGNAAVLDFVGDGVFVTKSGNKATVAVTGGGGGSGGSGLTDWPIASGAPTGVIPEGSRYYLTGSPGTILGELVAEGTVMEARVNNPTVRADWYFNFGGT